MASSLRQWFHRVRRSLGWITDDRQLERAADADQAEQELEDALESVDVEAPESSDPAGDARPHPGPHGGRDS